jgi:hypothetical protein
MLTDATAHISPQTSRASQSLSSLLALLIVASHGLAPSPAHARTRSAIFTGSGGQTASRVVNRQQGDVSASTTGPRGRVMSRQVEREPGRTQSTVTGPNGQTATRNKTYSDGSSTSTVTGPTGETATVERSVQP